MSAGSLFLFGFMTLLLFNVNYILMTPETTYSLTLGAVIGFVALVLAIGLLSGIQVLGSGLNSESIRILFGAGALLNIMFQINIAGFPIGMGLTNNLLTSFDGSGLFSTFGFLIATLLSLIILVSGLMLIVGGGSGE